MAKDRSNLYYLGVGCLIAGILLAIALAAFAVFAYRWGQGVEEAMKDPEIRQQRALEILGGDELPDGYHAMVGVRIPYFLETAILTDEPPDPDEDLPALGRRGLIYTVVRNFGRDRDELERFFSGELVDPEILERNNIRLDLGERLADGRLEHASGTLPWVTHRGEIAAVEARGSHSGLVTLFLVECPDDQYNRIGIWYGPAAAADGPPVDDRTDPSTADATEEIDAAHAGTVADPEQVAEFLHHFRFCNP